MPSFHSAGTLPVDHTLVMTLCKASLIEWHHYKEISNTQSDSADRALQSLGVTGFPVQVAQCAVRVSCADWDCDFQSCAGDHCSTFPASASSSQMLCELYSSGPQSDSRHPSPDYKHNTDITHRSLNSVSQPFNPYLTRWLTNTVIVMPRYTTDDILKIALQWIICLSTHLSLTGIKLREKKFKFGMQVSQHNQTLQGQRWRNSQHLK